MERTIRRWRQFGMWLPAAFVAAVAAGAVLGIGRVLPDYAVVLIIAGLALLGAAVFSSALFRMLEHAEVETEQRSRELAAVNEASLALSSDLDLNSVLQRVVDLSRDVANARYGALALLGDGGRIEQFLTSGITAEERRRIGALPVGRGLLGAVIHGSGPLRVDRMADDARSSGFPPNHPPMTSFIGLPITYEGQVVGDLYLTDKNGGEPFTMQDEETLHTFAAHAAIAIENARLYQQVQDLAVLEERERIGMDLHDGVIQSLYATSLRLESCLADLADDAEQVSPQLEKAIEGLNQNMADIRGYIHHLRPHELAGTDLASAVGTLLQELKVNAILEVQLIEEPGSCRNLSEQQVSELFHVARESLTNVRKHANAARVSARLEQRDGIFRMTIADDGAGFDPGQPRRGQGLRNIRERVDALRGRLDVEACGGQGTTLIVEVPVATKGEG